METTDHQQPCACGDCRDHRREAALTAAKELPLARRSAADCSDFWGCVAMSVEAIAGSLPQVSHINAFTRIELATQLKRLVDIMDRASLPLIKIDSQNVAMEPPMRKESQ
jgi:hypothetical protein